MSPGGLQPLDSGTGSLHEERLDTVCRQLVGCGARQVVDLGCGSGGLLGRLVREPRFERVVGLESSAMTLRQCQQNLRDLTAGIGHRVELRAGSYTQLQPDLYGFEAAAMVETIEHVPARLLGQVEHAVFRLMHPGTIILTTPNAEFNPLFDLAPGEFREADHKFEWDRGKFRQWCAGVARRTGYRVRFGGIGEADPELGPPTQTAEFTDDR